MIKKNINDLLFHASHGLCRIEKISRDSEDKETTVFVLIPVLKSFAKVRFMIPENKFEDSGFKTLMTVPEANQILDFFKTGKKPDSGQNWDMAIHIADEAHSGQTGKDLRKRQQLGQYVKALAGEISCVLQISIQEACDRIRKNLRQQCVIKAGVLVALAEVGNSC